MKKPGERARLIVFEVRDGRAGKDLLDFLVHCVALQEPVVLLLLDPLGDRLLVPERQVAGGRLALFLGFSAFQSDLFLHGFERIEGERKGRGRLGAIRILSVRRRRAGRLGISNRRVPASHCFVDKL